tara:strand:- start:5939 stop:6109 length:171 start_codon:yes stop_codon:yes gene_type:complete
MIHLYKVEAGLELLVIMQYNEPSWLLEGLVPSAGIEPAQTAYLALRDINPLLYQLS